MDITTRRSKVLALLFFVLSYLTLCVSVPTNSIISRSASYDKYTSLNEGALVKRGVDPEYKRLLRVLEVSPSVEQDDEKFMAFGSEPAALGSSGFAGCVGLVITSSQGTIIGHYTDADEGISRAKVNMPDLIDAHKDALAGARAWTYGRVKLREPDEYTGEELLQELETIVKDGLGIIPQRVKYIEPEDLMVDDQGELLVEEEIPDEAMYGLILVQHPGGQSKDSIVTFVNLDWQKAGTTPD